MALVDALGLARIVLARAHISGRSARPQRLRSVGGPGVTEDYPELQSGHVVLQRRRLVDNERLQLRVAQRDRYSATGVIRAELLSLPVLADSAAYAVGEARRWALALVPASPSVEATAADQKHDDNYDEKGGHIHNDVPLARRPTRCANEVDRSARREPITSSKRLAKRP